MHEQEREMQTSCDDLSMAGGILSWSDQTQYVEEFWDPHNFFLSLISKGMFSFNMF